MWAGNAAADVEDAPSDVHRRFGAFLKLARDSPIPTHIAFEAFRLSLQDQGILARYHTVFGEMLNSSDGLREFSAPNSQQTGVMARMHAWLPEGARTSEGLRVIDLIASYEPNAVHYLAEGITGGGWDVRYALRSAIGTCGADADAWTVGPASADTLAGRLVLVDKMLAVADAGHLNAVSTCATHRVSAATNTRLACVDKTHRIELGVQEAAAVCDYLRAWRTVLAPSDGTETQRTAPPPSPPSCMCSLMVHARVHRLISEYIGGMDLSALAHTSSSSFCDCTVVRADDGGPTDMTTVTSHARYMDLVEPWRDIRMPRAQNVFGEWVSPIDAVHTHPAAVWERHAYDSVFEHLDGVGDLLNIVRDYEPDVVRHAIKASRDEYRVGTDYWDARRTMLVRTNMKENEVRDDADGNQTILLDRMVYLAERVALHALGACVSRVLPSEDVTLLFGRFGSHFAAFRQLAAVSEYLRAWRWRIHTCGPRS